MTIEEECVILLNLTRDPSISQDTIKAIHKAVNLLLNGEFVIRCKDCKIMERYTTAPEKYQWDGFCEFWARNTYDDYWCCGAERKEE